MNARQRTVVVVITHSACEWCGVSFFETHRDGDKPAIIRSNGSKEWWVDGVPHRDNNQPAVVCYDGTELWFVKGKRHRENIQPAVIYPDGTKEWWVNGKCYMKQQPIGY